MGKMKDLSMSIEETCDILKKCNKTLIEFTDKIYCNTYDDYSVSDGYGIQLLERISIGCYVMSEAYRNTIFGEEACKEVNNYILALSRFRQCFYYLEASHKVLKLGNVDWIKFNGLKPIETISEIDSIIEQLNNAKTNMIKISKGDI